MVQFQFNHLFYLKLLDVSLKNKRSHTKLHYVGGNSLAASDALFSILITSMACFDAVEKPEQFEPGIFTRFVRVFI